ncbi:MAG TPA: cytochrome c [Beijerinckiaceae bacterium]|nr:cytochrome c [Beijerinckiaceae bacterium]
MIRTLVVAAALAIGATAVVAQGDVIAQRKDAMKGVGDATKPIGAMLKGEMKFELAAAQNALKVYQMVSKDYDKMFPDNSKTGGETTAAPKIWEDRAGFKKLLDKLNADAGAAAGAIKDEASFKTEMGKVLGNCKACHDDYRVKKS